MIGVILIVNARGDIILSRALRDGFSIRVLADTFRNEVLTGKRMERCPVNVIDRICYQHIRYDSIYVVACSNANVNCFMVFQYMIRLLQVFHAYFHFIDENSLKENFVAAQEIIDETLDFGYPQLMETDVLKSYITTGGIKGDLLKRAKEAEKITVRATGRIPWRKDGIEYARNELYLDVIEDVSLLLSQTGAVLQRDVTGQIAIKSFLSGMPECHLMINDKALLEQGAVRAEAGRSTESVELDDVTFHSCVRLHQFESDRSIVFTPPDGETVLMRYRSSASVNPPFRILNARVKEVSRTRIELDFRLKAEFPAKHHATDVVVKVPCPQNTATVKVRVAQGKAKYDPSQQATLWKIKRLQGEVELAFSAELSLISSTLQTGERAWSRAPISLRFTLQMLSVSGVKVTNVKVTEPRLGYQAYKFVRYMSSAGQYQCRI